MKAHALLPDTRDARLAPTLICAGLGVYSSDGRPKRKGKSVNRRNARWALTLICAGLGGCSSDGGAEEQMCTSRHGSTP